MEAGVGKKIKKYRSEKGLTLKELGERANLSVGYLSLVERGRSSISLTSLQGVATALGVGVGDFLSPVAAGAGRVTRGYDLRVHQVNSPHSVYHSLSGGIPRQEQVMEPLLVTLLPGQDPAEVLPYAHDGEEFGYVLEGTLTFYMEDKRYDLAPGDSLHIPSNVPHNWANCTNKLVKLLYVCTIKVFE